MQITVQKAAENHNQVRYKNIGSASLMLFSLILFIIIINNVS